MKMCLRNMLFAIAIILTFSICKSETPSPDETLTWWELILETKQDKQLKQDVTDWVKNEFKSKRSYATPESHEALFEEFIPGIIQDTITTHLLANIIKQKATIKPGAVLVNPEDTST